MPAVVPLRTDKFPRLPSLDDSPAPNLENVRIISQHLLPSPAQLHAEIQVTPRAARTVLRGRAELEAILAGRDERFFLVVGPCSIHDIHAALEYAERLFRLSEEVSSAICIVMRVYFEKPRTSVGWKGLINDPHLDDSFDIPEGMRRARQLLVDIGNVGLPTATEALDPLNPQYLGDLVSWNAIGARTTESQTHRELASGLSTPVGFKNGTDGGIQVAINAMQSAATPHRFLGVDFDGRASVTRTTGNEFGHLILRGGLKPNYDSANVSEAANQLSDAGVAERIVVDCSHGNSSKQHDRQLVVLQDVASQVRKGQRALKGAMLESNLVEGAQKLGSNPASLVYGQSVTDACIGWEATREAVLRLAGTL